MSEYFWANPAEQAEVLLESHGDDIEAARRCARINALDAPNDDGFLYWAAVIKALPLERVTDRQLIESLQVLQRDWN
jgi:hypothetical protein